MTDTRVEHLYADREEAREFRSQGTMFLADADMADLSAPSRAVFRLMARARVRGLGLGDAGADGHCRPAVRDAVSARPAARITSAAIGRPRNAPYNRSKLVLA